MFLEGEESKEGGRNTWTWHWGLFFFLFFNHLIEANPQTGTLWSTWHSQTMKAHCDFMDSFNNIMMCRTLPVTRHRFLFEYVVAWSTANTMNRQHDFTSLECQNTYSANQQCDFMNSKMAKTCMTKRCGQLLNSTRRPQIGLQHY